MAKRGRPKKQSARRKNGEGGFRERIKKVAIKSKKGKAIKECFICRNCTLDRATICKNREDCNSCELCKNCEEHKDCDKFRFYKYYESKYIVGYEPNGKPITKTFSSTVESEVTEKLNQLKANPEKHTKKNEIELRELARDWIEVKYDNGITHDNGKRTDEDTFKRLDKEDIFHYPVQKLVQDCINSPEENILRTFLKKQKKCSQSIIKKNYSMVNNSFIKAVTRKIIPFNPLDDKSEYHKPKPNKQPKKVTAFKIDDHKKLIELVRDSKIKHKNPILLGLYTGIREGELCYLKVHRINWKTQEIEIRGTLSRDKDGFLVMQDYTKTDAGWRNVKITPPIKKVLEVCLEEHIDNPDDFLFCRKNGSFITGGMINSCFKRFCEKHKIDKGWNVNFHQLRHTARYKITRNGCTKGSCTVKNYGQKDIRTIYNTYDTVFDEYEEEVDQKCYEKMVEKGLDF